MKQQPLQPDFEGDFILNQGAPFALDSGEELPQASLHYAMYGKLNNTGDNAILACHALTGSARVADWWPELFHDGHPLDVEKYCVIGINVLGSCYGSTGPGSINPTAGKSYGADFPVVSIRDMVRAQAQLIQHLGIHQLRAVLGGSIGGMQALQWTVDFPERVAGCFSVGAAPLSAMGLALNHLQREIIRLDQPGTREITTHPIRPQEDLPWHVGSLSVPTNRRHCLPNVSDESPIVLEKTRSSPTLPVTMPPAISITRDESSTSALMPTAIWSSRAPWTHLTCHADTRVRPKRCIESALALAVGISSDWLFPAADVHALAERIQNVNAVCNYIELHGDHGHDAFLAEVSNVRPLIEYIVQSGAPQLTGKNLRPMCGIDSQAPAVLGYNSLV